MKKTVSSIFLLFTLFSYAIPRIESLNNDDLYFKQLIADVDLFYQAEAKNDIFPTLAFYTYVSTTYDSLFTISSRLNIPIGTIATLNKLSSSDSLKVGTILLLPNQPGLFVEDSPSTDLARIINLMRHDQYEYGVDIKITDFDLKGFFLQGARFSSMEQEYFYNILFQSPLSEFSISSSFGYRESPFTNTIHFHQGIDLAAPAGTTVNSVRDGTVVEAGYDDILGNYIKIRHDEIYETIYGHLDKIMVNINDRVLGGQMIGTVGSTGLSTGPHLHFEIHKNGNPVSPQDQIRQIK